jgi:hypothetical protein
MEKITQTTLSNYETKQIGINIEAYNILLAIKNKLIAKHKKNFTFSDAIIEIKNKVSISNIQFSNKEIKQIKIVLKGGILNENKTK